MPGRYIPTKIIAMTNYQEKSARAARANRRRALLVTILVNGLLLGLLLYQGSGEVQTYVHELIGQLTGAPSTAAAVQP